MSTKELINIEAKKRLGQNFLVDESAIQLMIETLEINAGDFVIEVGPGTGILTESLADSCEVIGANLHAIEFDKDLIPILESKFSKYKNTKIVNANILNFLDEIKLEKKFHLKFIGSLPYNITSPLLHRILRLDPLPSVCVFLVQKEVAYKICQDAPKSTYLSVLTQTFYEPKILKVINREKFIPTPKVDGAIVKFVKRSDSVRNIEISRYEKFLHHVFSKPRKMLNKVFNQSELKNYGLDGTKRPQDYAWKEYLNVFNTKINNNH